METNGNKPSRYFDVVFDGPPSPEMPRLVEVEDENGKSIDFGEWTQRPDGYWVLRFPRAGRSQQHHADFPRHRIPVPIIPLAPRVLPEQIRIPHVPSHHRN